MAHDARRHRAHRSRREARAVASAARETTRGATSVRRASPIVFMARAAAPMLPGWLGARRGR
ncbi:MAG: hypothetical protein MZW92_25300 [Comamonadaceae bacterium]|nr:hypothetical protein [Comamonadaceae bacterium]